MLKTWAQIKEQALELAKEKGKIYTERIQFEIFEIEKQGSNSYWEDLINSNSRFDENPNSLLLPWLMGLCVGEADTDPIINRKDPILNSTQARKVIQYSEKYGHIPSDILKDSDMPDIDLDCLPSFRDELKEYAIRKYSSEFNDGYGAVCSVGTWQTYKFRSALIDICAATGEIDKYTIQKLTTSLEDEVDELREGGFSKCKGKNEEGQECGNKHRATKCPKCGCEETEHPTIGKILATYPDLANFAKDNKSIVSYAVRLIGRIRNMGMHAGALIIADRSLYGNVPMAKSNKDYWISMWPEGQDTYLSKFGYTKFDILGLKTLEYIYDCCRLIKDNRGIRFTNKRAFKVLLKNGEEAIIKEGETIIVDGQHVPIEQYIDQRNS